MKPTRALALVLLALLFTWVGQVALGYFQVGKLEPVINEETNLPNPPTPSGLAQTGARVFASEGCIECHSLTVRGPAGSSDLTRGWGPRRSVPRDYLLREPALIGFSRIDLIFLMSGSESKSPTICSCISSTPKNSKPLRPALPIPGFLT